MDKFSVMFVDDDEAILETYQSMLRVKDNEWDMTFAASGEKAWEFLQAAPFDVIALDVDMPDLNGLDLLKRIKGDPATRATKVVMITGLQDADLKRQALELGATDLLPKPVRMIDLIARLNNVLRHKQNEDELRKKNDLLQQQLVQNQFMELVGLISAKNVHDLKNINMIISGFLELMKMDVEPDSPLMDSITEITTATGRMDQRVKQIMKIGKPSLHVRNLDVGGAVTEAIGLMEPFYPKNFSVQWDKPDEPIKVKMAHARLLQVLLNLLMHITESVTQKDELTVQVDIVTRDEDLRCPEAGREYVRLGIRDTGKTVSENALKKLFDLQSGGSGGKGAGLAVSKDILEQHGGRLAVEADADQGTVRTVLLPVSTVDDRDNKETSTKKNPLFR